jgi:hypothetical protein
MSKYYSLDQRIFLYEFNKKMNTNNYIIYIVKVALYIQNYKKKFRLFVINFEFYNIILE